MKEHYVKTKNYYQFVDAINRALTRGADEATNVLVYGPPGTGKTECLHKWANENNAVYLRADQGWSPAKFIGELADKLNVEKNFQKILGKIAAEQIPLIVDEANHCLDNEAAVMERIRDISDRTEAIVIYSGDDRFIKRVGTRYKQISSRFSATAEFKLADLDDVAKLCNEMAEVAIATDLIEEIHRQSAGRVRSVISSIAVAEKIGKKAGGKVALADCLDMELLFEWDRGSIKVKGARHAR